jgi:hypothetical protein
MAALLLSVYMAWRLNLILTIYDQEMTWRLTSTNSQTK